MKIGYPCINLSLNCRSSRTFRLASYSDVRMHETIALNLACLQETLRYNVEKNMLFFRITSDLIPFASHEVCSFKWQVVFSDTLKEIGRFIRENKFRISMHPDQFVLINSLDERIFQNSLRELSYHAEVLDLLGIDRTAKIQIHAGRVYGGKDRSMERFIERHKTLPKKIRDRLVIEGERLRDAVGKAAGTWSEQDGIPMVDYSSQEKGKRTGTHAQSIDISHFKKFLKETDKLNFDIMLEIKDKEKSALKALKAISGRTS
ncbi:MAG: hypothetical protein JSV11_04575 [Nitrospiraceae bacterium]|nr:MAG: hypothetical protein JSV11_04575 [Nitrospiraceae bacterium]